jgi:lipopolysaccharide/colanic/teichoic acid biosynthesis glycosyltransferase
MAMRAVIVTTAPAETFVGEIVGEPFPAALLPVGDRPLAQHVGEWLIERGVTEFDFIIAGRAYEIETLFGDGTRWGSRFRYHLARDAERPYRSVTIALGGETEPFLLGHAEQLPGIPPGEFSPGTGWTFDGDWTGWAMLTRAALETLPSDATRADLAAHLQSSEGMSVVAVESALRADTFQHLLDANRAVLEKTFPGLLSGGREAEAGVWLSRNVNLHPTVRLIPPVFISENCRIGEETELGPYTIVGPNCILDRRCRVAETLLFGDTYVGEELDLHRAVVDGSRLLNVELGVAVTVTDDFLLSRARARPVRWLAGRLWRRVAATFLLLLTAPVLVATMFALWLFRRGPIFFRREVVALPASSEPMLWRTYERLRFTDNPIPTGKLGFLFLHVLPGLWNVARGDVAFIGVDDRSPGEIEALPGEWRQLYLKAKGGLLSEALVNRTAETSDDDRYAAETCYAVRASFAYDARLAGRFLLRTLNPLDALGKPTGIPSKG